MSSGASSPAPSEDSRAVPEEQNLQPPTAERKKPRRASLASIRVGSMIFKDKALREFPSYLRLMQLPVRDFPDIKVGRLFNLPASVYHQFWLSFTFGFANCNSFRSFNIFASLMTGNMVLLSIRVKEHNNSDAAYIALCVISFFVFGTVASNLIIEWVKDRYHSFALIYLYVVIFIAIVEYIELGMYSNHPTQHSAYVCFLIGGMGMLCHWCYKMNYQVVLHIGNVQKILEYGYNKLFGYKVGGKRGIGDIALCTIILIGFMLGCIASLSTSIRRSLFPLILLFPVHLYSSGTWDYWMDLRRQHLERVAREANCSMDGVGMGETVSPFQQSMGSSSEIDASMLSTVSESSSPDGSQYNPFGDKEDMMSDREARQSQAEFTAFNLRQEQEELRRSQNLSTSSNSMDNL